MIPLEAMQPPHSPALIFPGLEIRLHQRRVLKDGTDIDLTRLEYGAFYYLSTLTMVGLLTIPIETKYLGKKIAVLRNVLAFVFSFITAYLMGVLLI